MSDDYLPKVATISESCEWLERQTGSRWTLARLLECGQMPWFWLDYTMEAPSQIFGHKVEGYLAPMIFGGDTHRLEMSGDFALVTMTKAHDGTLLKFTPGMRLPLSELRFKRESLRRVADTVNGRESLKQSAESCSLGKGDSIEQPILCTKKEIIDGFLLVGKGWEDILSRPEGDGGRRYLEARKQPGRRGKGGSALWSPIVFARLLIENNALNLGQVKARFVKAWPQWEAEMLAEIGEI